MPYIKIKKRYLFSLSVILFFNGCKVDTPVLDFENTEYPEDIAKIILTNCATSGCHNDMSKDGAAGLSLSSWENMFKGSRNGAITIPFNHEQSSLFLFTNVYDDIGAKVKPTMPVNANPLSRDQIIKLKKWIDLGAPNKADFIKFSDNTKRKKAYITNQGCDLVCVIDIETGLIMRYINVGRNEQIESPHTVKVSPNGDYWYVIFNNSNVIQKYSTIDDSFVGEINIGLGNWNTMAISSDSKKAFLVNWNANGSIAYVDLESLTLLSTYQSQSGLFAFPHGIAIHPNGKQLYVSAQTGNFIYKIDITNPFFPEEEKIVLEPGAMPSSLSSIDPHEIVFTVDGTKYFISCQKSNELRVFNANNDSLISKIQTGKYPQEMSFSKTSNYLFVTCTEDDAFSGTRGSVTIVDYNNNTFVKNIKTGYQPHGIAVCDSEKQVYVAHRNIDTAGPTPHHTTACKGRNGYLTLIDLNTLELIEGSKTELSVDPYSVDIRK